MASIDLKAELEGVLRRPVTDRWQARRAARAATILDSLMALENEARAFLQGTSEQVTYKGMPLHDAVEHVLRTSGTPLHAHEIADKLRVGGWVHPRSDRALPQQLYHQISARLPRFPQTFSKIRPATWALVEWADMDKRAAPKA